MKLIFLLVHAFIFYFLKRIFFHIFESRTLKLKILGYVHSLPEFLVYKNIQYTTENNFR